jgi:predicted dehydrogenase
MGAGGIARRRTIPEGILPANNAELVAVYAPQSGEAVAREFGVQSALSEADLYRHDFDAVYIASPVDCHARQVAQAAAAGRHVLCEKPLSLDVAQTEQMLSFCERAGVTLGVGFMMRFHPHHQRAADMVADGELGAPVYARAQLSCWYPPIPHAWRQDPARSGGGALPDLASHCIDVLEMILADKVRSLTCRLTRRVHDYPVEDTCVLLLEFERGATATVDCLFNVPDSSVHNRLEIYGSQGSLLAEGTLGQSQGGEMCWMRDANTERYSAQQDRIDGGMEILPLQAGNIYRSQIEDFGDAVLKQRSPLATGKQGVWIQRILAACQQSAAERRTITVEAFD